MYSFLNLYCVLVAVLKKAKQVTSTVPQKSKEVSFVMMEASPRGAISLLKDVYKSTDLPCEENEVTHKELSLKGADKREISLQKYDTSYEEDKFSVAGASLKTAVHSFRTTVKEKNGVSKSQLDFSPEETIVSADEDIFRKIQLKQEIVQVKEDPTIKERIPHLKIEVPLEDKELTVKEYKVTPHEVQIALNKEHRLKIESTFQETRIIPKDQEKTEEKQDRQFQGLEVTHLKGPGEPKKTILERATVSVKETAPQKGTRRNTKMFF
ncbi:uncharacterized protein LOC108924253 [Scleropages formosus]|uniref:uncharacterized protein LOC108924253 n=1 Tax=Scleropages formosus TaxID=113540 RepID=UPI00087836D5|nr:uncharacterized protein LOC108924253 [Scleropages formosus]